MIVLGVVAVQQIRQGGPDIGGLLEGLTTLSPRAAAEPIEGRASVIDGDTIEIAGQRIRFNGIDAPESAQSCEDAEGFEYPWGRVAAIALDGFLAASRPTRCQFVSWDQYGRFVGDCARADGFSVQAWLVENGHGLDWPRYSRGAYAQQQAAAQQARRGIWPARSRRHGSGGQRNLAMMSSRLASPCWVDQAATSRATSRPRASASTMCRARSTTAGRGYRSARASAGFVPRRKRSKPAGASLDSEA